MIRRHPVMGWRAVMVQVTSLLYPTAQTYGYGASGSVKKTLEVAAAVSSVGSVMVVVVLVLVACRASGGSVRSCN